MPIMDKQQIEANALNDIMKTNLRNALSKGTLSELVTARLFYEY